MKIFSFFIFICACSTTEPFDIVDFLDTDTDTDTDTEIQVDTDVDGGSSSPLLICHTNDGCIPCEEHESRDGVWGCPPPYQIYRCEPQQSGCQ